MNPTIFARLVIVALVSSGFTAAIPFAGSTVGGLSVATGPESARRGPGGDYYAVLRGAKIVGRGKSAFYELTVRGIPDETAQVSITLPDSVGFEEIFDHGQFFECSHPPIGGSGTIECSASIVGDDKGQRRIAFSVSVPSESTAVDFVIQARVSGPGIDPEPSNNTSEVRTGIVDASSFTSDVGLGFEGPVRTSRHSHAAFLRLVNNGPSIAVGIQIKVHATYVHVPSRGVVVRSEGDSVARWQVDALGPNETATLVLRSRRKGSRLRAFVTKTDSLDANTANDTAKIDYSYTKFVNCGVGIVNSRFEPSDPVAGDTVVAYVSGSGLARDTYVLVDVPVGMRLVKTIVPGVGTIQAPPTGSDAGTAIFYVGDAPIELVLVLEVTTTIRGLLQDSGVEVFGTEYILPGDDCIPLPGIEDDGIAQIQGLERVAWLSPDPAGGNTAPPRNLSVGGAERPSGTSAPAARGGDATLVGYNIYRSHLPGVAISPSNLFASVGPTQTSVTAPAASGGSFFRVTASYATGEGGASNEAEEPARVPGPRLTRPPVIGENSITAEGTGFTSVVSVFVDGIPFVMPARVESANTKVKQEGNLLIGVSLGAYLRQSGSSELIIRNSDGGTARTRIQP